MKCLFLDIDGVLSSWKNPNFRTEKSRIWGVCEADCLRMNELSEKYGFETILSSTYRLLDSETEYLKSKGLKIRGRTPNFNGAMEGDPRSSEIAEFIKENGVTEYVILDDSPVNPPDSNGSLIRTTMENGMLESDWDKLSLCFAGKRIGESVFAIEKITEKETAFHPESVFVFGDNSIRKGRAGQAVIRNEKNSFGIATKRYPSMAETAFFGDSEKDFETVRNDLDGLEALLESGKNIVFPKAGVGTGLAKMAEKSPKLWKFLCDELDIRFGFRNGK